MCSSWSLNQCQSYIKLGVWFSLKELKILTGCNVTDLTSDLWIATFDYTKILTWLKPACVMLVMSAKKCWHPPSGPQQIQQIIRRAFRISFHLDWQIDDGIYNRPIIARTRILVQRWRPRTRISVLFRRRTFHLTVWYRLDFKAFGSKLQFFHHSIVSQFAEDTWAQRKPNQIIIENEPESLRVTLEF